MKCKPILSKCCITVLLLVAFLFTMPLLASASENNVAKVGSKEYTTLKDAFDNALSGETVTLLKNIEDLTTDGIVTIPEGKAITLDMAGKTITVDSKSFKGRVFINKGPFLITGNGTIDTSLAGANGWGPVDNYGTLTIENGTYKAVKDTESVGIWNREGGTAYFKGGVYEGFPTVIRAALGANTTISGGTYLNDAFPAIENDGEMLITGGTFKNVSCSSCDSRWGYTIRNGVGGDEKSHLVFEESSQGAISVTGVQGAVANSGGLMEIKSGSYKTVGCSVHGTKTAHYALYVAGENCDSKAIVTGGTFESASKTAVMIGNDNTNGDGGINADATTEIKGGTFIAPKGQAAVTGAEKTGNPEITGGAFSSDPGEFVKENKIEIKQGNKYYVGATASKIIENLKEGDEIIIIAAEGDLSVPEGVKVKNETGNTIIVNGQEIENGMDQTIEHILVKVPAKEPTCTENGNKEYYICSVCGEWFASPDGRERIEDHDSVILKAKGHRYENGVCEICGKKEVKDESAETGDPIMIGLVIGIMGVSGVGIASLRRKSR